MIIKVTDSRNNEILLNTSNINYVTKINNHPHFDIVIHFVDKTTLTIPSNSFNDGQLLKLGNKE